ncbi:MAG: hypothetical protein QGH27_03165 [SAR324 cluster bacterium]|nr:hypothetical protein [SAR324 cluster bacterium]
MPEQGVSDFEEHGTAQAVGKVDAADQTLTADGLGIRIQGDGFDRSFTGAEPQSESENVGYAVAFGLLLKMGAGIGVCLLKL